jgi:hypothetical protein
MALSTISTSNFRLQGTSPLRLLTRRLHPHGSRRGVQELPGRRSSMPCDNTPSYTANSVYGHCFNSAMLTNFRHEQNPLVQRKQPRLSSDPGLRDAAQSRPHCRRHVKCNVHQANVIALNLSVREQSLGVSSAVTDVNASDHSCLFGRHGKQSYSPSPL